MSEHAWSEALQPRRITRPDGGHETRMERYRYCAKCNMRSTWPGARDKCSGLRLAKKSPRLRKRRIPYTILYRGNRVTMLEAVMVAGVDREVIRDRIRHGWSVERAVETPARRHRGCRSPEMAKAVAKAMDAARRTA